MSEYVIPRDCQCETCRLIRALDLEKHRDTKSRRESLVLIRAVRLAPDLETFEELLRTARAPRRRLVPEWAKAYGLR